MLLIKSISTTNAMVVIATVMAVGGLLNAKRVAETMSKKITPMNHGQGITANLVTATLVIFASKFGVPVSTHTWRSDQLQESPQQRRRFKFTWRNRLFQRAARFRLFSDGMQLR